MIEEVLRAAMLQSAEVYAAVGISGSNPPTARIWEGVMADDQRLPAIVFNMVDQPSEHSMKGASNYAESRVQIDSYAITPKAARELDEHVRLALIDLRGTLGGVRVDGVERLDSRNTFDHEVKAHCRSSDYLVMHGL